MHVTANLCTGTKYYTQGRDLAANKSITGQTLFSA